MANQGRQKEEVDALPFVERRARSRTKVLVPPTHKAIPALRQWIIGWWITNPNMGKTGRGRDQRPSLAHAQEHKSRPSRLTGTTAPAPREPPNLAAMAQGTGHVSTKKIRAVGAPLAMA